MRSYLHNRQYSVVVDSVGLATYVATSGVPQGSHLGPQFFNIFINDLASCIEFCHILLYADDAKLFRVVKSNEDCLLIQEDLVRFYNWCTQNHLALSVPKCTVVRFTTCRSPIHFDYSFDGVYLQSSSHVRDLGVFFSSDGSFAKHICDTVAKAFRILGFVNRNSTAFRSHESYRLLYLTLVRPILEYASSIWTPHTAVAAKQLESVQHKFLRNFMFRCGRRMHAYDHD